MKTNRANIDKFITEALAIEEKEAQEAGALGYMARALTQATMPHKKTEGTEFVRRNGNFTLTMLAPSETGLPYGSIPRLLVAWVTTEAVRTKSPLLELGPSMSGFMAELGLTPTGGRWGTITRLKDQTTRLFSSSVSCIYKDNRQTGIYNVKIVDKALLWWNPKSPDQAPLWQSTIELNHNFYEEVTENPVPVDMRALKALKRSPLALDTYCWLTHRMSYLRRSIVIPWGALQLQFGSNYADTPQGRHKFKTKFLEQLRAVLVVYPSANVEQADRGLLLKPGTTHISASKPRPSYLK